MPGHDGLEGLARRDLLCMARERGILDTVTLTREQLIQALRAAPPNGVTAAPPQPPPRPEDVIWVGHGSGPPARRSHSRRRAARLRMAGRILAVAAFAMLTAAVGVLVFASFVYHQFVTDLQVSNARVPGAVAASLKPGGGIDSQPNVALFEGLGQRTRRLAGSFVLLRTDPGRHRLATISVPQTAVLAGVGPVGEIVRDHGTTGLIAALGHLGIRVNHVGLIDLPRLARIIDSLGGVVITNPAELTYRIPGTTVVHVVPAGRVRIAGPDVEGYLRPYHPPPPQLVSPARRQDIVLRGLIESLLHPTSLSAIENVGKVLSAGVSTDLSPSEVLGYASVRLAAVTIVACTLPAGSSTTAGVGRASLARFAGKQPSPGAAADCGSRTLSGAFPGFTGTIERTAVANLPTFLISALAVAGLLWVVFAAGLILALWRRHVPPAYPMPGVAASAVVPEPEPEPVARVPGGGPRHVRRGLSQIRWRIRAIGSRLAAIRDRPELGWIVVPVLLTIGGASVVVYAIVSLASR
ncbi:MAG TPA: LCP family protein [Gaiellales bacterium]|nr:LCP family protein [Gaiellales bacterium]